MRLIISRLVHRCFLNIVLRYPIVMYKIFTRRYGKIKVFKSLASDTIVVEPEGIIGIGLLREYLTFAEKSDKDHEGKFNHIVDTSLIKFANPINPLLLRRISKLKHLNLYVVIVPSNVLRILVSLTKWINKPDYIFKSLDSAESFLRESTKTTQQ